MDANTQQGLFGMNVNVLASNPSWWWYIVVATVILGLTVIIWMIFKRFRGVGLSRCRI
jgi:Mg2+ and Co2+ transporter CorA